MSNPPKGQSLDADCLDLELLDHRVLRWKTELGLLDQPEFPPRNIRITDDGVRFHDRSHILVQDYLGKTSQDFCKVYKENSLPSVYEELLTFFCAKIAHHPNDDPKNKTDPATVRDDIFLMKHLGYLSNDSILIKKISTISREIGRDFQQLIGKKDFQIFKATLLSATQGCEHWEELEVLNG